MELIYMWVYDYKNLKKQSFNLSSNYRINFEYDENLSQGSINIEENKKIDFYNIDNTYVNDIIGIIGKNGSGKTNLLEAIQIAYNLNLSESVYLKNSLFIFREATGEIKIQISYVYNEEKKINKDGIKINSNVKYTVNEINLGDFEGIIEDTNVIFYSPIVDAKYISKYSTIEDCNIIDISNSYHLIRRNKNVIELYMEDIIKQFNYIQSTTKDTEGKPQYIRITISSEIPPAPEDNYSSTHDYDWRLNNQRINLKMETENKENFKENEKSKRYFKNILYVHLYRSLLNYQTNGLNINDLERIHENNKFSIIEDFEKDIISLINYEDNYVSKWATNINELFTYINDLDIEYFNYNYIQIKINDKEYEKLEKFLTINKLIYTPVSKEGYTPVELVCKEACRFLQNGLFEYQWQPKFSFGEMSFLQLYGRFYNVLKDIKEKNVVVLIDEGELGFHPEWQREYICNLIKFFGQFDKNVKIIITSHSPFVCSDLLRDSIVFISQSIMENFQYKHTFAANIHSLFVNSFFMNNTIGEFANKKIKVIAKELSKENSNKIQDREEIDSIINIIGEPIIQKKLRKMYDEKFKHFEINNRLEELSDKIEQLQNVLKDDRLEKIEEILNQILQK